VRGPVFVQGSRLNGISSVPLSLGQSLGGLKLIAVHLLPEGEQEGSGEARRQAELGARQPLALAQGAERIGHTRTVKFVYRQDCKDDSIPERRAISCAGRRGTKMLVLAATFKFLKQLKRKQGICASALDHAKFRVEDEGPCALWIAPWPRSLLLKISPQVTSGGAVGGAFP